MFQDNKYDQFGCRNAIMPGFTEYISKPFGVMTTICFNIQLFK